MFKSSQEMTIMQNKPVKSSFEIARELLSHLAADYLRGKVLVTW